jgi:hypothetical protein
MVLVAAQWGMALLSPGWPQASFRTIIDVLPVIALLGLPALAVVAVTPVLTRLPPSRPAICAMIAAGLAMRHVWYGVPVTIDDDYFRYLWDGAVLASGFDPYAVAPSAVMAGELSAAHLQTLAARAGTTLDGINFPELTTIYPGTAQLAFALAYLIAPFDHDGLRVVMLGAELATLALLMMVLSELDRPPLLAALFWLNPLIVWASHGTGHSEAFLSPLLLGACLAVWRGRNVLASALLALAIGVKIWPILLVPLFARLIHSRRASLVAPGIVLAGLTAMVLAPLALSMFQGQRSGLVAYSNHWWTNNGPFSWISYWVHQATNGHPLGQRILRAVMALSVAGVALWVAWRPAGSLRQLVAGAMIIAAATFYAAPAQFPWYALWFLALAAAVECRPLLAASATLAVYYLLIPLSNQGAGEAHNYGFAFLHALPVWAWLAWNGWTAWRAPAGATPH